MRYSRTSASASKAFNGGAYFLAFTSIIFNGAKMESKRFTKNDNGFICENCGAKVEPLGYSSRNHCPFCLCSKHVDVMPGDRANQCGGIMDPIRVEPDSRKGYVIIHKCRKCGEIKRNKAATEAKNQPDDIKKIITNAVRLSNKKRQF